MVNTTGVVAVTNVNMDAVLGASTVTTALTVNPPGAFTPIRIDSGRTAGGTQTVNGVQWSQDTGFSGGGTGSTGSPIAGTTDDVLYQNERWGTFIYTFTVPEGNYSVTLKFAETFFTGAGTGQRVFDVNINGGALELDNFDIKAAAGGAANTAVDRTFAVTAGAGANNLVIQFIDAGPDDPKVDAIQIVSAGPPPPLTITSLTFAPPSVTGGNSSTGTVTLSANAPAGGVNVAIDDNASTVTSFAAPGTADARTLNIPAGSNSGTFVVNTTGVVAVTNVNMDAVLGASTVTTALAVNPPGPLTITSLTFAPSSVTGGSSSTGTVTLSANAPAGGVNVAIDDNASTVTSFAAPGTADARTLNIPAGSNSGTFVVNTTGVVAVTNVNMDAVLGASTVTTALTVNPPGAFTPIRIDSGRTAGGTQTVNGVQWSQDTGFSGGGTGSTGSPIAGTTDDVLYQNERWGTFIYTFTVPEGNYSVTLKFAETFFTGAGTGQRVFDVNINGGALELDNFDIKAAAGGAANTAVDRTFAVTAGAGANNLVIQFIDAGPDDPKVDAIQIVAAP